MPELSVVRWRSIPMQVLAREGKTSARAMLSERFQEAVDASAMVAGLIGSDDYTSQMAMDRRPCGDDLESEVRAEADRLEASWSDEVLRATIRSGGVRHVEAT